MTIIIMCICSQYKFNKKIMTVLYFHSFEATGEDNRLKMHRSVSSDDVREFSTGARVKDVQLKKEEDIEYQSGHLFHSSGVTSVKLARSRQKMRGRHGTQSKDPLNDQVLSANGSYSLDLVRCSRVPSAKRGRRSEGKPMMRDSLKATENKGGLCNLLMHVFCIVQCYFSVFTLQIHLFSAYAAKSEMKELRRSMQSVSQV